MNHNLQFQKESIAKKAATYRKHDPDFANWATGYGVIEHTDETQVRMFEKMNQLSLQNPNFRLSQAFQLLAAADRVTAATMWLVVHATYAQQVYLDGRDLQAEDFKIHPEGHTGGSLNMVPGYVGYLVANALSGFTRSWMMGQGHCVSAIDAANVLVANMTKSHESRYQVSDQGLTQFVQDFYSYAINAQGKPASPLGSHVNPHTAGGIMEGGYLGFAELEYVHMPLLGERLVVFLSDGAFEEQRGSDWAPRFWRAEDSGLVCPILIANGRRIDQRSTVAQEGGSKWLSSHLALNGFDPIEIDGRDPAAFAWAILEMEERLTTLGEAAKKGRLAYPVPLPYTIATTIKGYGFPGAGTNASHNLPLLENPRFHVEARQKFHQGARMLWVPPLELNQALALLNNHSQTKRPKERDHACAKRQVALPILPEPSWQNHTTVTSPMGAIDGYFCELVQKNPQLRVRLGNPDELRSNGMGASLDLLKHRVPEPEQGIAEAVDGRVITALNEETVICAALGNKGGLNLAVTYEAFAPKMLGALRQEIIFSRHQKQSGQQPGWLSVPLILTSHTWENGKNEQSHQDPTLCEALWGEMNDVSRVLFPADANSAMATLQAAYRTKGQIWTMVVPKRPLPVLFTAEQASKLLEQGAIQVIGQGQEEIMLYAVGAYQLGQALLAAKRLQGLKVGVIYLIEPGKFRIARDEDEKQMLVSKQVQEEIFPSTAKLRVVLSHTRPHVLWGLLPQLRQQGVTSDVLGYINQGGTLDTFGMLFANQCTFAHIVAKVAQLSHLSITKFLTQEEIDAVLGQGNPRCLDIMI